MPGQSELFSILMHYVCIRERGEMSFFFFLLSVWVCVCVYMLDSANSHLHFPCTACEMFSDVGTAIIYKACSLLHPLPLFISYTYLHARTLQAKTV